MVVKDVMNKRIFYPLALSLMLFFIPLNITLADTDTNMVPMVVDGFSAQEAVSATRRIVGGEKSIEGDWPWMAALVYAGMDNYNGQFCGGALIDGNWVATAAHCTEGLTTINFKVVLGTQNLIEDPGQTFFADLIIVHENYNPINTDSDIALIHLTKSSDIEPLALVETGDPKRLAAPLTNATAIGWGATDVWGSTYPAELRQVTIPITPPWAALRAYGAQDFTINMLAAGLPSGGKDACSGDSGGPLVVFDNAIGDWVLVGITSWGEGCAQPRVPGVYTRISRFTAWVESMIGLAPAWCTPPRRP